jgi:hypothetical protein
MDMTTLSNEDVFRLWAGALSELRRRGLTRTADSPVGGYGELLVAQRLGLELAGNAVAAFDAIDKTDGSRYQIKSRRVKPGAKSPQLSAIRNLHHEGFDYLVVVVFEEDLAVRGMWKLPIEVVREHATYRKHVNAHILYARDAVLADPRVERLA